MNMLVNYSVLIPITIKFSRNEKDNTALAILCICQSNVVCDKHVDDLLWMGLEKAKLCSHRLVFKTTLQSCNGLQLDNNISS